MTKQEIKARAMKRLNQRVSEYPNAILSNIKSGAYDKNEFRCLVEYRENTAKAVCHLHYLNARYKLAIEYLSVSAEDNAISKQYGLTPHALKDLPEAKSILRNVIKRATRYATKHNINLYISHDYKDPFFRIDIGGFNPLGDLRDTDLIN
jgi:hypothetical protein